MKNILLALVCLVTFSFKNHGTDRPKCCTDKCSKECIEMCKKNNCTDANCCKDCSTKGCQGSACKNDKAAVAKNTTTDVAATKGTDTKSGSCCKKK